MSEWIWETFKPYEVAYVKVLMTTLWDPMDCIACQDPLSMEFSRQELKWVAIPFSRGSSLPKDWTWVSCIAGRFFTIWATREIHKATYSKSQKYGTNELGGRDHYEYKTRSFSEAMGLNWNVNKGQIVTKRQQVRKKFQWLKGVWHISGTVSDYY